MEQKTIEVDRGLFLVRYAAAEDESSAPSVRVSVDRGSSGSIALVLHPEHDDAVLWEPGASLVVRAAARGKLHIEVVPRQAEGSIAATVRLEPLTQGEIPPVRASRVANDGVDGVRVLGHVAGIGDVVVHANQWIAGPTAPSRIEGLSIDWPGRPEDLDFAYAVQTARAQPRSSRMFGPGAFAGTRGRALPVVGVTLELSGPRAAGYQFCVEAIFLGSPVMRCVGPRVALSGPTGREPLVGLKVGFETVGTAVRPAPAVAAAAPDNGSGRVRVFRSRARQDHPASL